jgi:hypothetical protein
MYKNQFKLNSSIYPCGKFPKLTGISKIGLLCKKRLLNLVNFEILLGIF